MRLYHSRDTLDGGYSRWGLLDIEDVEFFGGYKNRYLDDCVRVWPTMGGMEAQGA